MAITAEQMKANLQQARRSTRITINASHIKRCLSQGISKKSLCGFYGCTYKELKEACQC